MPNRANETKRRVVFLLTGEPPKIGGFYVGVRPPIEATFEFPSGVHEFVLVRTNERAIYYREKDYNEGLQPVGSVEDVGVPDVQCGERSSESDVRCLPDSSLTSQPPTTGDTTDPEGGLSET